MQIKVAGRLRRAGLLEDALAIATDVVTWARRLVENTNRVYNADLALALDTLADVQFEIGDYQAVLHLALESLRLQRSLAVSCSFVFTPQVIRNLRRIAAVLVRLQRHKESLLYFKEILSLSESGFSTNRQARLPQMALDTFTLAMQLKKCGQLREKIAFCSRSADLYLELTLLDSQRFFPVLIKVLLEHVSLNAQPGGPVSATSAMAIVCQLAGEFYAQDIRRFRPLFVSVLGFYSSLLSLAGDSSVSLVQIRRVVCLLREECVLLPRDSVQWRVLMYSLNELSSRLDDNGLGGEAAIVRQEAGSLQVWLTE